MQMRLHFSGKTEKPQPKHFDWYVEALNWGKSQPNPGNPHAIRQVAILPREERIDT